MTRIPIGTHGPLWFDGPVAADLATPIPAACHGDDNLRTEALANVLNRDLRTPPPPDQVEEEYLRLRTDRWTRAYEARKAARESHASIADNH